MRSLPVLGLFISSEFLLCEISHGLFGGEFINSFFLLLYIRKFHNE